jgi:phosphate/sulfate permease
MLLIFVLTYTWYQLFHGKKQSALKESNMYKKLQLLSSAAFSLGHGGADSQKVMGIICAALMVYGNMARDGKVDAAIPKYLQISEMMQHAINEEFNYNLSQQVYVSAQTWTTIKIVKEQTLIFIKTTEKLLPENATKADFLGSLIIKMQEKGEIPHEKGLQMIRAEIELLFN